MAALGTMAGADVLRADLDLPARGPWSGEVRLATETVPAGAVTLAFTGGLTLKGKVRKAGSDGKGAIVAFVVGGNDGLRAPVAGHFRNGHARDVLAAIVKASGETQATDIASNVLAVTWGLYTLSGTCHAALDTLAAACARSLGVAITWRIRAAGDLWIGAESWTATTLKKTDAVLDQFPGIGCYFVGVETPTLTPGIALAGVGNVAKVKHFVYPDKIRTLAITA